VTSIGDYAFSGCSGLTSIIVEEGNTVYDSRDNCNAIIKAADNTLITGCKNTVIPSSVTSIGDYAFESCRSLTSLTIPASVTSIGYGAFAYCSGLTSLTIPKGVTSIGRSAFYGCTSLTSLTIPSSVTSIGDYAFSGFSSLTSVAVGWETPLEINNNSVFNASNYNNATLYVPKGTKAAYQAASVWQDFETIEEYEKPQDNVAVTDVLAIDNVIYMEPLKVTKGKEVDVTLKMKNTAGIRGFQFDMYLPIGVTVKKDGNNRFVSSLNNGRLPDGSVHTLTVSEQPDGAFRFLCGSQYDETFTGTKGDILTVRLCIDERMFDGQYPVILKDMKLTETNIDNYYLTETLQTAMTVLSYVPGDISGDGEVDVSDYIGVANHIMGNTPEGFNVEAADVNKDNVVDVLDYIGIANLILYNSVYGNTNVEASRSTQRRAATDVSTLNNAIYIEPFTAEANGETQVSIKMKNTAEIRGFQFDLYLPEGMTAKKDANSRIVSTLNNNRRPAGDQHTLTMSEQPDGAIRFLCGSQFDETFTGADGEIATLTICVAANVAAGEKPVYLRKMKLTETDISKYYVTSEVETTVTVTGAADGRIVLSETSTTAPEDANGVDVRIVRTIYANEWSTICLPFAMTNAQVTEAFGDGVLLGDFNGYVYNEDDEKITVKFNSATAIEANHPYIIKVTERVDEFTVDGVDIVPSTNLTINKGTSRRPKAIIGNYIAGTKIGNGCLFLNSNKFYYSVGTTEIGAYRAYFNFDDLLPEFEDNYAEARITITFDDEATGIDALLTNSEKEKREVFNLKGTHVLHPKKGIYVKDGKKVVIK
jgi:hypothetical protein